MGLSVTERENFRKAFKNMISQMKKSEIVEHFTKQGIASTIYNTINRIQNGSRQRTIRERVVQPPGQLQRRKN